MIVPTIGRVVWYHPIEQHDQPYAAMVSYVHSTTRINVGGFTPNGVAFSATSVFLSQGAYQKQVAAGQIPPMLHATTSGER